MVKIFGKNTEAYVNTGKHNTSFVIIFGSKIDLKNWIISQERSNLDIISQEFLKFLKNSIPKNYID